jgi:hypothetical protein
MIVVGLVLRSELESRIFAVLAGPASVGGFAVGTAAALDSLVDGLMLAAGIVVQVARAIDRLD